MLNQRVCFLEQSHYRSKPKIEFQIKLYEQKIGINALITCCGTSARRPKI